jgi:Fe2+ transport system protein FeoA
LQERRLCELRPGEQAIVSKFIKLEDQHIRKLLAFGVLPGTLVKVLQVSPTLVIRIDHTQLALDREFAAHIAIQKS